MTLPKLQENERANRVTQQPPLELAGVAQAHVPLGLALSDKTDFARQKVWASQTSTPEPASHISGGLSFWI